MTTLGEIAPHKADRALIIGGTRSGKSTLMDWFMRYMMKERPNVQILLLDSKPRFRAEIERFGPGNRFGRLADKRYADWESGPVIPHSCRIDIDSPNPLEGYWPKDGRYKPFRVAIAQTEDPARRRRLLEIADNWYAVRSRGADRVLAIDELLDYYHRNTISVHSSRDVPLKVVRAGGERGFGALYGAQRPKRASTANHRRTVCPVSVPSQVLKRHQVSVGHGHAVVNHAARRSRRRLRFPRYSYPPWWKSGIRSYVQIDPPRLLPRTTVGHVEKEFVFLWKRPSSTSEPT